MLPTLRGVFEDYGEGKPHFWSILNRFLTIFDNFDFLIFLNNSKMYQNGFKTDSKPNKKLLYGYIIRIINIIINIRISIIPP